MFNLILFGPPGSGKGTQSNNIIEKYNLYHISTGDLLREEIQNQTKLGIEAKKFMDEGQLVPDALVIDMIGNKLDANPSAKGFIFDGFPRTTAQADALDALLVNKGAQINILISLEVPEETLKQRLLDRGLVSGRSDDNESTINKRIIEYKNKTEAVAAYYNAKKLHVGIKGDDSIEEVFEAIVKTIDAKLNA